MLTLPDAIISLLTPFSTQNLVEIPTAAGWRHPVPKQANRDVGAARDGSEAMT